MIKRIKNIKNKRSLIFNKVDGQRQAIVSRLKRLRRDDPFATTDRSLIVEPGTDAAALYGHERTAVLEGQLKDELKEIEKALTKIKKGTYGVCEKCGKKIDSKRLSVKPAAIYCLKCEKAVEAKRAGK